MGQGHSTTVFEKTTEKALFLQQPGSGEPSLELRSGSQLFICLTPLAALVSSVGLWQTLSPLAGGAPAASANRTGKRHLRSANTLQAKRRLPAKPERLAACADSYDGSSPLHWEAARPGASVRVCLFELVSCKQKHMCGT